MLVPNHLLQNRYRIIGLLGQGGMGHVYEAIDNSLDLNVAIKETFAQTDSLKRAFEREAKLLAKLQHNVLPRVSNHFVEGDGQFLVMDYIKGNTLLELLDQRKRPFTPAELLPWIEKLLQALEYLHERPVPVIHRDIKPANVKVDGNAIYLLDFGLAKGSSDQMAGGVDHTLTSVFGYTAAYAPVEQIMNTGTTARSDLYSLGATIYHLVTGTIPVKASLRYGAMDADQPDPLIPADQYDHRIPAAFAAVVGKAMAVKQKDRYASAAQMRSAFRAAAKQIEPAPNQTAPTVIAEPMAPAGVSKSNDSLPAELPPANATDRHSEGTSATLTATQLPPATSPPAIPADGQEETDPGSAVTIRLETRASSTQTSDPLPPEPARTGSKLNLAGLEPPPVAEREVSASSRRPLLIIGAATLVVIVLLISFAVWGRKSNFNGTDRSITSHPVTSPSPSPATKSTPVATAQYAFVQDLPDQEGTPRSVAISPDGERIAAASSDGKVRFWHAKTMSNYLTINTNRSDVYTVAFSPDGKKYAYGGKGNVVWLEGDLVSAQANNFTLKAHTDAVTFVAFSPDGKLLASASRDETVRLWNTSTGELVSTLEGKHTGVVWSVAFSSDGKYLASAGADKTVVIWNIEDRNADPTVLKGFDAPVVAVAFSPDGRFLAASGSIGLMRVWNANDSFSPERNIELPSDHEITVTSLAFSSDSKLLISASFDGLIRVWKSGDWDILQSLAGHGKPVFAAAISADMKTIVSGSEDGKVKVWR